MNLYYWLGYNLSRLVGRLFFRFRVIHRERMIQNGPVILAMNHQSYLDPPLAGTTCDRPIYFLARKTLMDVPLLGWLLPKLNVIPVNQEGIDRSALKALIRVLKSGNAALVFPEGSRTLDGNLQPAEPGLGLVIAKTLAPVVPMRIFGAHEALPRGSGGLHFVPITIVIGEPIFFTTADVESPARDIYQGLSQRVMDGIAALHLSECSLRVLARDRYSKVNSTHPAGEPPPSSRVPRSGLVLMLMILGSMALLAVYANIQRFRRERVETVIVTPATSPSVPTH
jgi:1-acyl-sn-glycerol-3-phosphate acyltransferase